MFGRAVFAAGWASTVLIDFWAIWCEPRNKEMPGYQLIGRYGVKGLAVVGLKFDIMKDTEDPSQFANRIGVRYPLAVATDELKQKSGAIEGLPPGHTSQEGNRVEYTNITESEVKPLL